MRIFYSHSIKLYGTDRERSELARIRAAFAGSTIVNPSDEETSESQKEIGHWLNVIESCDCVVFSRLAYAVTIGVEREVNHALATGKEVYELRGGRMLRVTRPVNRHPRRERVRAMVGERLGIVVDPGQEGRPQRAGAL